MEIIKFSICFIFFKGIQPIALIVLNNEELYNKATEILQKKYDQDISPNFAYQILYVSTIFEEYRYV